MSEEMVFACESPHTPEPSGSYLCSYPNCDWGDDCVGDHSYSNWRLQPDDEPCDNVVDQPTSMPHVKLGFKVSDGVIVVEISSDDDALDGGGISYNYNADSAT